MELGRGGYNKFMNGRCLKKCLNGDGGGTIALNPNTVFVIKIPDVQLLRIVSRSLFLAFILVTLPFLGSILRGVSSSHSKFHTETSLMNVEQLNFLLHDLTDEGLFKKDDKVLIITPPSGFGGVIPLNKNEIEVVLDSELERKSSIPNGSYDFVFTFSSVVDAKFIDSILKTDGIVALPLDTNPSNAFEHKPNFRVAYLRRYSSIIVALRKTSPKSSSPKRKLFQLETEAKKIALKGLEDVLLEPPKQSLVKSRKYLNKIKYLPDLMGDSSLEGYKRRIFIGVGLPEENKNSIQWFKKNYPKSEHFEIHSLQIEAEDQLVPQTDVSNWLSKHVKEEEFVVMKAEAEVVEEMIRKRTISIVDELFLECKNDWWKSGKKKKKIGRAYWECLALYGRLRDEGVAVHQWWG